MSGSLQFTAHSDHGEVVAPSVQADFGHQPPQAFGPHAVVADYEPCRLRDGCYLMGHGNVCGQTCWARISQA